MVIYVIKAKIGTSNMCSLVTGGCYSELVVTSGLTLLGCHQLSHEWSYDMKDLFSQSTVKSKP